MLQLHVSTFLFMLSLFYVSCSREVTLSCGSQEVLEEGIVGSPPSKLGVMVLTGDKGEPGVGLKGSKGEQGDCNECEEKLMRLEERVGRLEQQLNEERQIVAPVEEDVANSPNLVSSRRDCNDVGQQGFTSSGVYNITVDGGIVPVFCDMEKDGGNWLVIQKRLDGSENFVLGWEEYTRGFGELRHEFWLGLQNLHLITSSGSYMLRVNLEDWENNEAHALYSRFSVGDSASNYTLQIGGYSGTAGNAMLFNNNWPFTTHDRDNDNNSFFNCAEERKGAWWHNVCTNANLNGMYVRGGQINATGINWLHWRISWYSMKTAEMKIRRN